MAPTWRSVPALRAALALAAGIGLGGLHGYAVVVAVACAGLGIGTYFLPLRLDRRGIIRGSAILLLVAGAGFAYQVYRAPPNSGPASSGSGTPAGSAGSGGTDYVLARLLDEPAGKGNWAGADAMVIETTGATPRTTGERSPEGQRVRLMFDRDSAGSALPKRGAVVITDAPLRPVDGPRNPHAFDYRAFLAARGVMLQAWLRAGEFEVVRAAPAPGVLTKVRTWIGERIDAGFGNARDAGVAKALLIGDKSGIDEATRLTYTATGAVHVLAVSGLHTGIISAIVVFVVARAFGKRLPWLQYAILLLTLAGYIALTGFAPSVIRAAIMFAVVFGGRFWRRDAPGLNNLGVAAVLTLLYDPNLLHTLGFQLSYLAVAGIMLFYAPVRRWLQTPLPRLNVGSDLAAVSIAATLGTFPVTVFHFHQFPVYFALSGLIAVPLVGYALPLLLCTLALDAALSALGVEAALLYHPAHFLVWVCNEALGILARLPYVLVEGLWPSAWVTVPLLLTVWSLGAALQTRRRGALRLTMALAVVSTAVAVRDAALRRRGAEAIVYSLREATVVDVRSGAYTESDSDGRVDARAMGREVMPHRYATGYAARRSREARAVYADSTVAFYASGGWRWAALRSGDVAASPTGVGLDWVIVEEPSAVDPEALTRAFPGATVVLATRPPPWERDAWAPLAERTHLLRDGAFVLERDGE